MNRRVSIVVAAIVVAFALGFWGLTTLLDNDRSSHAGSPQMLSVTMLTDCTTPQQNPCTERYSESDGSNVVITAVCQVDRTVHITVSGERLGDGIYGSFSTNMGGESLIQAGSFTSTQQLSTGRTASFYVYARGWNNDQPWGPNKSSWFTTDPHCP